MFKNARAIFTSSFFLNIIFVSALFILIFISGISYRYTTTLTDSSSLVVHSYKIRIELEQLMTHLKDAESGQQGFILTRDSIFLDPYLESREKINSSFTRLKLLTDANFQQQQNLDSLYKLINIRLALLNRSMAIHSIGQPDKDRLDKSLIEGEQKMNLIRDQVNDMIDFELMYLNVHQDLYEREISLSPIYTLVILLFSLLVFIFAYFQINRDIKRLKRSNEKLSIAYEAINHAEEIGGFSSWQWHLESDTFDYSNNQFRLLGLKPQSFKPGIEKFLEFVHPNDRHIVLKAGEQIRNEKAVPVTIFFRIIRQDGEQRYFKSIAKLFTDNYSKKIIIGIHSDITEQYLNRVSLEERNKELEQSNKELATFNHIASHDLQEPLRIIQTYISRISDQELSSMTPTTKGYFGRIQATLNRMRMLINDLLEYSRTNKGERIFELTDLNQILELAKQELAPFIEEKNALIESGALPKIQAIPFQIQQLLINLIGNSLRFSHPDRSPQIKVTCEEVQVTQENAMSDQHKNYYKISITDNGLGFEQKYAEHIFVLFHRLHQKHEYPGSGIGLSICKKIAENHGGYITAEGQPDVGSVFNVFIPH